MSTGRWLLVGALVLGTALVVLLDASGIILDPDAGPEPVATAATSSPSTPEPTSVASPTLPLAPVLAAGGGGLRPATVKALRRALADPALGAGVSALVVNGENRSLFGLRPTSTVAPASTLKLLTSVAALEYLGPNTRLQTQVVDGTRTDHLVLVGGGDATLARESAPGPRAEDDPASLEQLARATAAQLRSRGQTSVRLAYDDSAFVGPAISPAWEPDYVTSGEIAPVTALMVDEGVLDPGSGGVERADDPARQAATVFAAELAAQHITVRGPVQKVTAPAAGATDPPVAMVESPPVALLVERMLTDSDNQLAEALGRLAAAADGRPASFSGATAALRDAATTADVPVRGLTIFDASGLARGDRLTVRTLSSCLAAAAADDALRPVLVGLPVAGFSGTLDDRYLRPPSRRAAGLIRAKTGTLTGVTAQAGVVVSADGDLRIFAVVADEVPYDTDAARQAMDDAMSLLAGP
ncbi:MAG: D-alanyl-D-alanine carboxypeptidase/D-alanyl-D-alanine-endopeptidase [Actinomycetes bacterium]